jgi:predicted phosphodiesterase
LTTKIASIAVLSDIHGVMPALEAVLAEPDVQSADRIVVNGDAAAGPQPIRVLEALLALGDRVVWVRGNADRELLKEHGEHSTAPDVAQWAALQLGPHLRAHLAALPHPVELEIEGLGPVLFAHATPESDEDIVLVDTRLPRWVELVQAVPARIGTIVVGHTHMPFVRLVDGRTIVNPGSVGMPYGPKGAHWALLDKRGISLRRTVLNAEAAIAAIGRDSTYPKAREWAETYLTGRITDLDAHASFAPRDGRKTAE